jgi:hypothetical protein
MATRSSGKTTFWAVKPGDFASVREGALTGLHVHINAQPVMRAQAVLEQDLSTELLIRRRLQQFLIDDGDVPLG